MVDLQSQYVRIQSEIDAGIREVLASAAFVKGPKVREFAEHLAEWLGVRHVIPVGNGTDALQIALMSLGLERGDEVITPSFTFVATAEAAAVLGLKPVLVDVRPDTFNIDVEALRRAITPRTKAIVPVHLFGQCSDMEEILAIADEHGLRVVEDACQAIGAEYRFSDGRVVKAGCMGDLGCTSFFPSKNLGCYGDGGAIFTNDDALAERAQQIANHGSKVRYHHDLVGVNSRLDAIQAAVLDAKLPHLDEYTAARQKAAAYYDKALAGNEHILLPVRDPKSTHVFHQYTLRLVGCDRDKVREALAAEGVPSMVYYPVAVHAQTAYAEGTKNKDRSQSELKEQRQIEAHCPVAEELAGCVLSLPMHTELDEEQLEHISTGVLCAVQSSYLGEASNNRQSRTRFKIKS